MKNSLVTKQLIWVEVAKCTDPETITKGITHLGFVGKCRRTFSNAWCSYGKRDPSKGYFSLIFFERFGKDVIDSPILTVNRAKRLVEKELNRARLEYLKKYYQ